MKNSPGSMIGGIGLTTCVRDVQFARTIAMTSSTSASSTPRKIVAFDCLRNPPELLRRVARNSLSRRALTRAPASSLWMMATMSFTRGVSASRATRVNAAGQSAAHGGVYDAGPHESSRPQEPPVSTIGPSRDPSRSLIAAIDGVAGAGDIETALDAVLTAAASALDATMGAIL